MTEKTRSRPAYHHGDLPSVLIKHTEALLSERGVEGFSLREVARRAGVAAAAPSHHFGNATGLLTAVATKSFREMNERFLAVLERDPSPEDHLLGICTAYIAHHEENPGGAAVMFNWECCNRDDADLAEAGSATFAALKTAVRRNARHSASDRDIEAWAKVIWSSIHGIMDLRLTDDHKPEELIRLAAFSTVDGRD